MRFIPAIRSSTQAKHVGASSASCRDRPLEQDDRMSSQPAHDLQDLETSARAGIGKFRQNAPGSFPIPKPISALMVAPTLDVGAADAGVVALVRILAGAGHRTTVVARAGRLVSDVTAA